MIEEGKDSKADIYITADAGRLGAFDQKEMFQNLNSSKIEKQVPKHLVKRFRAVVGVHHLHLSIVLVKRCVQNNVHGIIGFLLPARVLRVDGGGQCKQGQRDCNAMFHDREGERVCRSASMFNKPTAASTPLLPCSPPDRAAACSWVSSVSTQNITGLPVSWLTRRMP